VLILAATVVAAALRLPRLEQRPMHGDEAVHADRFGTLLEEGRYEYDPREYHGPTLNYLTLIPAWFDSAAMLSQVTERTLRIVPAAFGLMLVLLLLFCLDGLGPRAAAYAAILTAISPAMVFYSRYYIQEMLLVCFTFGAIVCGYRYVRSGKCAWAIVTGAFLGLMHATKETCVIAYASMLLALGLVLLMERQRDQSVWACARRVNLPHVLAGLGAAVVVSGLFFSSFLTNSRGILDSVLAYGPYLNRAHNNALHNHPWHYYLSMLLYFRYAGGPIWTEGLIVILALVGLAVALTGKSVQDGHRGLLRFVAFYTVIMTVVYSVIPYKTPWCVLGFLHGMILLAGVGVVTLLRIVPNVLPRLIITLLVFEASVHLCWQGYLSSYRFYADSRNPYVYAHPTQEVLQVGKILDEYARVHQAHRQMDIRVICPGADYWPLPWYLRSFGRVGYHSSIPPDVSSAEVVVISPSLEGELAQKLLVETPEEKRQMYMCLFEDTPYYIWLRPNVKLTGFVRRDLWERRQRQQEPAGQTQAQSKDG
jgi:uncharacterized protein (TIGR03663 family)